MFNPTSYENSRPGGLSVLEVVGGERPVDDATIPTPHFVPLKSTELRGEIMGPLASLHLTQVYGYAREQCDRVLEAVYRFPLPGDAAVTGLRVRFGEVEIQADLQERQQAESAYQEARRRGQQAALFTRESPDVFSLFVAGLHPDQDIIVETSYVQLARMEGPGWSLMLPLTTAPRYVRSDELAARHAQGQPLLLLRDPGHRFGLDLRMSGAMSAVSITHPLTTVRDGDVLHVGLRDGPVIPDRDFVLSWEPQQEPGCPTLRAWTYDDRAASQVYFLASVAPPASRDPEQTLPREVILLVDHSGSMEGAKWAAADWAVTRFLSELTERDIVNLGLFHNTTRWFSTAPRHAFADTIARAREFVEAHRDSGGTELGVALEQALAMERHGGTYARHILGITDAQVSDAGRILRLADHEWQQDERCRISVLCIDAAPNSFLTNELAERGGGVARFLTSAPEEDDITTALDEVLADWAQPVQTGLRLEVNRGEIETSGRRLSATGGRQNAIDVGDLPGGRTVWVCGRAPAGGTGEVAFRLVAPGDREVATYCAALGEQTEAMLALKALFGARRVLGLEFLMHAGYSQAALAEQLDRLGYHPQQVLAAPKLYAENVRAENERLLRPLLVQKALAYGLASAETAFVAVRREQGQRVEGTVPVGNALPAGWSSGWDGFEPAFAVVPEGEALALEWARAEQDSRVRRASIGITAGQYKGMVVLPRSSASPLLRLIHAEPLPFGGYIGSYNGQDVVLHHLDIVTSVCKRFWPDVTDFLYGPEEMLNPALREVGIEPVSLPADLMDPFERGVARYAIYGT